MPYPAQPAEIAENNLGRLRKAHVSLLTRLCGLCVSMPFP
jgi:hypothetical protein